MKCLAASAVLGLTAVPPAAYTCGAERVREHRVDGANLPCAKRHTRAAHRAFLVVLVLVASLAGPTSVRPALQAPPVLDAR